MWFILVCNAKFFFFSYKRIVRNSCFSEYLRCKIGSGRSSWTAWRCWQSGQWCGQMLLQISLRFPNVRVQIWIIALVCATLLIRFLGIFQRALQMTNVADRNSESVNKSQSLHKVAFNCFKSNGNGSTLSNHTVDTRFWNIFCPMASKWAA